MPSGSASSRAASGSAPAPGSRRAPRASAMSAAREAGAAAGASQSWALRISPGGRARRCSGVPPLRARCSASTSTAAFGWPAAVTTATASSRVATTRQPIHSRSTPIPYAAARSQTAANRASQPRPVRILPAHAQPAGAERGALFQDRDQGGEVEAPDRS